MKTTIMANGRTSVMSMDMFDRATAKTDLGGNVTTYSYDVAGRMSGSAMTNYTTANIWLNNGKLGGLSLITSQDTDPANDWTRDDALYGYDLAGNRILETLDRTISGNAGAPGAPPPAENPGSPGPNLPWWKLPPEDQPPGPITNRAGATTDSVTLTTRSIKHQTATYDALGRLSTWAEAGTDYAPAASLGYAYDAAGNIRRTASTFATLDATGAATPTARDYWFRFDAMNRVVVDQGELVAGTITGGMTGREIAYDAAGRRVSVTRGGTTELYGYDAAHRLAAIVTRPAGTSGGEVLRSAFGYDTAGRQVSQQDYDAGGTNVVFDRTAAYDAGGRLGSDASFTVKTDGKTYTSATTYGYGTGTSAYALGAVVAQTTTSGVWGTSGSTTATTTTDHAWYDGAQQSRITYSDGTNGWNTYLAYDGASRLRVAEIQDGKPRYVDYVSDELGQVVYRKEIGGVSGQTGGPHEVTYRFGGRQLGFTGNNGTSDLSVEASIADRQQLTPANQGTFRNKQVSGSGHADFAQSWDPLNSFSQGSTTGGYTVQAGDTLQGIAYQVWGDGALWYKLAEANGLSMGSTLIAGQQLTLPAGVVRTAHNAATMRPYDPADALGNLVPDTSPTPAPAARKKSNKCGVFGAILLAVVAVAVAVASAGTLIPAIAPTLGSVGGAIVGGALAGAAGSIASQAVGLATGIQEKFSFKGVALAALAGGIGGGLGASGLFGKTVDGAFKAGSLGIGSRVIDGAVSGLAGNIATQGIAIATGLQDKFDWAGVAVAGVVGGTVAAVNVRGLPAVFNRTLGGTAAAITGSAARSLIDGSSFGDNVLAALPQVIGSTIGQMVAEGVAGRPRETSMARLRREGGVEYAQNVDPNVRSDFVPEPEPDIVVTATREQVEAAKHGFFWHLGNVFSGRNWDGTRNEAYEARAQAERATSDSFYRAISAVDKAATDTKISPKFYYLQNPPMSFFDYQQTPRIGVAQVNVKGAALGALEVASLLPALRAGKYVAGTFELTEGVAVGGNRAIDVGASYEKGIRGLYAGESLGTREFDVVVDGKYVSSVADDVIRINGRPTAIEAKYVDDWSASIRNPSSPNGEKPWAVAEQQNMLSQARAYSANFEGGVIYHTNSTDLAAYYSAAFKTAGVKNVRFIITPALR